MFRRISILLTRRRIFGDDPAWAKNPAMRFPAPRAIEATKRATEPFVPPLAAEHPPEGNAVEHPAMATCLIRADEAQRPPVEGEMGDGPQLAVEMIPGWIHMPARSVQQIG